MPGQSKKFRLLKVFLVSFCVATVPSIGFAQPGPGNNTLTHTQSSTFQNNNAVFGCEGCRAITSATDPHPDTSAPIFSGDPRASQLPLALERGLPPDNQFGQGVPVGSSGLPITQSTGLGFSEPGVTLSFSNGLIGTPDGAGGRTNVVTQTLNQVVPGGDSSTEGLADQEFAIHFQVTSLTDPNGDLVGAATGTAVQTLNGVETTTGFSFDAVNGLVAETPFPYTSPAVPTGTP